MKNFYVLALSLFAVASVRSSAQTLTTLVNFDDSNGAYPYFMVQGIDGNLRGTTFGTGPTYCGTAFRVSPAGTLQTVTMNCSISFPDGNAPQGLIQGTDGNSYGVTFFGGANEEGSVFKLTPKGVLTTLVSFDGSNGSGPVGTLTEGTDGNYYGATYSGGQYGFGTVFMVTPQGVLKTLYQFDFTHGAQPYAGVIQATDGNFYGTTYSGGASGGGNVYKITSQGKLTVVYNFGGHAYDPSRPVTALVQGKDGNFYGTTPDGGNTNNYGAVFKLTPAGVFTTMYAFTGPDGYSPGGPLVQANDGNFWGTTGYNTTGQGTIFKITPSGTLTTVHVFDGTDGQLPVALIQDTNGKFYGSANLGGTAGAGTVFSLDAGLGQFVSFLPPFSSGKVGSIIQILGQGFTPSSTVSFNGTPATATVRASTYLTAAVPSGATTGFVTVTTSGVRLTSNKKFRIIPQITSISPTSGLSGTIVTITGVSLKQTTKVTFGGVAATAFTVNSDTQVTVTVPNGAVTGKIAITTPGGTVTSSTNFVVI